MTIRKTKIKFEDVFPVVSKKLYRWFPASPGIFLLLVASPPCVSHGLFVGIKALVAPSSNVSCRAKVWKKKTEPKRWNEDDYTPGSTNIAGWKMDPDWVDAFLFFSSQHLAVPVSYCQLPTRYFPIENGDFPACYVSLPEGRPWKLPPSSHPGFWLGCHQPGWHEPFLGSGIPN